MNGPTIFTAGVMAGFFGFIFLLFVGDIVSAIKLRHHTWQVKRTMKKAKLMMEAMARVRRQEQIDAFLGLTTSDRRPGATGRLTDRRSG